MPREVGEDLGDCVQCPAVPGGARPQMSPDRHTAAPAWPSPPCPLCPPALETEGEGHGRLQNKLQATGHWSSRPGVPSAEAWRPALVAAPSRGDSGSTPWKARGDTELESPSLGPLPGRQDTGRLLASPRTSRHRKALPGQVPPAGAWELRGWQCPLPPPPPGSGRFPRHPEEGRPWPEAPAGAQPRSNVPGLWAGAS